MMVTRMVDSDSGLVELYSYTCKYTGTSETMKNTQYTWPFRLALESTEISISSYNACAGIIRTVIITTCLDNR